MNIKLNFTVPEQFDNKMAKVFLRNYCNISSRLLVSLKKVEMGISRNGKLLRVIDNVYFNDIITIKLPNDNNLIEPVKMSLNICYEDEHIMLINKPPYMPVHPTHDHIYDTLANGVSYYLKDKNEDTCFRAINRLDRDTTGLVLIAKNSYCAHNLSGKAEKLYVAVCEGIIEKGGTVDADISLLEGHTIQRVAGKGTGIYAVTHYKPIISKNNHTLVEFNLETGRTHQIRVHMSYINHPLAGDDMYGGSLKFIQRQALHCKQITFIHPITCKKITITTDLPDDMSKLIR